MFDAAITELLRAVLDEVCEKVSRDETGTRAHVASKLLKATPKGETRPRPPQTDRRSADHMAVGADNMIVSLK
ncbi:hypothetical protein [Bradyrhizobium australiense]|uniref:hypothetical protein n=1 Tax=Bradyrhizobium australiense TaxID=2721161 RepID=UPI0028A1F6C6|nr:hypothetical protein [Bradyrhizobium australiense]